MGVFKLAGMTMKGLFTKAPTRKYPYEVREPYERTKGLIHMMDIKTCIFCGMCQRKCPADCIVVDKPNETWTYEPVKCVSCNSCVTSCPKKVLEMDNKRMGVVTKPEAVVEKRPPLTPEEILEKEKAEAEKQAKIQAALAAKKARQEKEKAEKAGE